MTDRAPAFLLPGTKVQSLLSLRERAKIRTYPPAARRMIFWNRRNEMKLSIKSCVFRILLAALLVLVLLAAALAAHP